MSKGRLPNLLYPVFLGLCLAAVPQRADGEGVANFPPTVEVDASKNEIALRGAVSQFLDAGGEQSFAAVLNTAQRGGFQREISENYGYTNAVYWYRFTLHNAAATAAAAGSLQLVLDDTTLYDVKCFLVHPGNRIESWASGSVVPPALKPIRARYSGFALQLAANETAAVYLRIRTYNTLNSSMRLLSPKALAVRDQLSHLVLGLYYGIVLGLALYNLSLAWMTHSRSHLLYVGFVVSTCISLGLIDGLADLLLGDYCSGLQIVAPIAGSLSLALAVIFTRDFLHTRVSLASYDRFLVGFIWLCIAVATLGLTPFTVVTAYATDGILFLSVATVTTAAILSLKSGFRPAAYYLASWCGLVLMTLIWLFMMYGVLPRTPLTVYGIHIGSAFEMVMMSLGLGYRINTIRAAATQAETRMLESRAIVRSTQMLAHDMKTPFAMLRSLLDHLAQAKPSIATNSSFAPRLAQIRGTVDSATRLLDDVTEIGSVSRPKTAPVQLEALIEQALAQVFADGPPPDLVIKREWQHALWLNVDAVKTLRVFVNIIANAAQAMTLEGTQGLQGSIWLRSTELNTQLGPMLQLTIGNDGPVVPVDQLEQIFEPFFSAGKQGGTGLGLAIAKKVVTDHGGKISCSSGADRGTEFRLTFPGVACGQVAKATRPLPLPAVKALVPVTLPAAVSDKNPRPYLAVLDDNAFFRELWTDMVHDAEIISFAAPDAFWAKVAGDAAWLAKLDAVVVDMIFDKDEAGGATHENGLEFAAKLAALRSLPIFISTNMELSADVRHPYVARILEKRPYSWSELMAELLLVLPANTAGTTVALASPERPLPLNSAGLTADASRRSGPNP